MREKLLTGRLAPNYIMGGVGGPGQITGRKAPKGSCFSSLGQIFRIGNNIPKALTHCSDSEVKVCYLQVSSALGDHSVGNRRGRKDRFPALRAVGEKENNM